MRRFDHVGITVGDLEAAVVFFSMTSSSGEDVPRGLDFRFNQNRFNVAVSRAKCLSVVVSSLPIIWFHGFALLVAAIPLWRADRERAERERSAHRVAREASPGRIGNLGEVFPSG